MTYIKKTLYALFAAGLFSVFTLSSHAEKMIIDTDFSKSKGDALEAVSRPEKKGDFPLKGVTSFDPLWEAKAPSTITKGKTDLDGLPAPYAYINIKRKSDAQIAQDKGKSGFSYFGGFGGGWNFGKLPLTGGVYQMTWTYVSLSDDFMDLYVGATLGHVKDDGGLQILENRGPRDQWPLALFISDTGFFTNGETMKIKKGKANEIVLDFDLNEYKWSLSINGKHLVKNKKFPELYLNEFSSLSVIEFQIYGGSPKWKFEDPAPAADKESFHALGNVKLVKLSD